MNRALLLSILILIFFSIASSCGKKDAKKTGMQDLVESNYEKRLQKVREDVKSGKLTLTAVLKSPWKTIITTVKEELGARKFKRFYPDRPNRFTSKKIPVVYHTDGMFRRDSTPPKGTLIENRFDRNAVDAISDKDILLNGLKTNPEMLPYILKQWSYDYDSDSLEKILETSFAESKYLILKPAEGFGGLGIIIVKKGDNIKTIKKHLDSYAADTNYKFKRWVFQEYLGEPMLYNGRKFHFRFYMVARRMGDKVTAFTYPEGWMYVAPKEYGPVDEALANIDDEHRHLTNIKLGGHEHLFPRDVMDINYTDSRYNGIPRSEVVKYVLSQINVLIYESSKKAKDKLTCRYKNQLMCFEIFGVDIIIDNKLNIKLLEYNSGTGYGANYKYDFDYGVCWEKEFIAATYRKTVDVALGLTEGTESKAGICGTLELQELSQEKAAQDKEILNDFRAKYPKFNNQEYNEGAK